MNAALVAFIAFTLLDAATTYWLLSRGGREVNPAMVWLMEEFGTTGALIIGKSLAIALAAFAWFGGVTLWPIAAVQAVVVASNGYQIYKQKHA